MSAPMPTRAKCRFCGLTILRRGSDGVWFSKTTATQVTSNCNDSPDGAHATRAIGTPPFRDTIHERTVTSEARERVAEYEAADMGTISHLDLLALAARSVSTLGALLGVVENLQAVADHAEGTPTTSSEVTFWWAVTYTPPGAPEHSGLRPCETNEHASRVLAGLPDHYLPARLVMWEGDEWIPTGEARP